MRPLDIVKDCDSAVLAVRRHVKQLQDEAAEWVPKECPERERKEDDGTE